MDTVESEERNGEVYQRYGHIILQRFAGHTHET
jgi:hypothetical protein